MGNKLWGMTDDLIDSRNRAVLRHEILRLRDQVMGFNSRREVLDDRIAELEAQVEELAAMITHLTARNIELEQMVNGRLAKIALWLQQRKAFYSAAKRVYNLLRRACSPLTGIVKRTGSS